MADFSYIAIDQAGREKRGKLSADNDGVVRARLAERNYYVVKVSPSTEKATDSKTGPSLFTKRLRTKELTIFTRQIASLVEVSPLEEALRTISRQNEKDHVRRILSNVHSGVLEGQRLSDAMRREPKSFPPLYRAMIAAGESSGTLTHIANRLAALLERQAETRSKFISALAYPIALTLVAFAVVMILMIKVVPKIVEQFDNVGQQLPPLTRIVIAVSHFLAEYWWALLGGAAILTLILWRALKEPQIRYSFDGWLLRLPFIGRLLRDVHAAQMARTLSTMVASRLPVLEGMKLTSVTIRNRVLRMASEDMITSIHAGGSLSAALRNAGVFPPLLVYLTASGESSGQLDTMLERAAEYLEREFDTFTSTALSLLEPAIIIIMGGAVAVIILSILLPILQLQNLAGL